MHLNNIMLAVSILTMSYCSNNNQNRSAAAAESSDTAISIQTSSNSPLDITPLSGYFVKNNINVSDSLTFWVIDNPVSFDSLFGMAKTMGNVIETPDFGTQLVVAAAMPVTYYGTQIQLDAASVDNINNNAELHFTATSQPNKNQAATLPLWLGTILKTGKSTIRLFNGDHLTKTITVLQ